MLTILSLITIIDLAAMIRITTWAKDVKSSK